MKHNPNIWIDNYIVKSSKIEVYSIIDGTDKDWSINRDEFEKFHEANDSLDYCEDFFNPDEYDGHGQRVGTMTWEEVYDSPKTLESLIKEYIQAVEIEGYADIEAPLKKITNSFKKAI